MKKGTLSSKSIKLCPLHHQTTHIALIAHVSKPTYLGERDLAGNCDRQEHKVHLRTYPEVSYWP